MVTIIFTLLSVADAKITYQQHGNTTFGSDGSSYTRHGNTVFDNRGNAWTRHGDTIFGW